MKKFKNNLIAIISVIICISCCFCTYNANSYNDNIKAAIVRHHSMLTTPGGSRINLYKVFIDNESYVIVYDGRGIAITKQ